MRDNRVYTSMCESPAEPSISRSEIEEQVAAFLARGGKVQQIQAGVCSYEPLSVVRKNKGKAEFEPGEM